jgi:hypothetical protein
MASMKSIKRFSDDSHKHRHVRVIQAWVILVGKAKCNRTITYTELSELMLGKKAPRSKSMRLGHLYTYCEQRNLPRLPAIVVEKGTRKPAPDAPYDRNTVSDEIANVFAFNWYDILPPTEADLDDLTQNRKLS